LSILESFSLEGRRALVTGATGGLGGAMAQALLEAGAAVAIIGREGVDEAAGRIGDSVVAVRGDLGDRTSLERAYREAAERLGGVDILLTSHGVVNRGEALEVGLDAWDETIEVNLTSVFRLCQLAAGEMIERGTGGKIVNVASMLSFFGGYRAAAYAASKGGIAQLTKALANEWSANGINVNAIAPGYIRTKLNEGIWRDPVRSAEILTRLPSGRWGEPADLRGAAVFLASSAADYLHGVILPVDGGFLAR